MNLYLLCTELPSLFHAVFHILFAFLWAQEGKGTVFVVIHGLLQPVMVCFSLKNVFGFDFASCHFVPLESILVIELVEKHSRSLFFFFFLHMPPTFFVGTEVIFYLNK